MKQKTMRQSKGISMVMFFIATIYILGATAQAAVTIHKLEIRHGHKADAAYFEITNMNDKTDALLSVESPAYGNVEIHTMSMANNVMRMRRLERVELPINEKVIFKRMGLHLMLFDPTDNKDMTFTFRFEHTEPVNVQLK